MFFYRLHITKGSVQVSNEYTLKMTPERAREMPMVDLAFELLKSANTPFYYRDLMNEIAKIKRLSEHEMMNVIAQLYTEINIDGRFACVGNNLWGLKRWYPIEKSEDAIGNSKRPRIINDDDDDLDEEIFSEEEVYTEEDDFGTFTNKEDFDELEVTEDADFIDEPVGEEELDTQVDLDADDEDLTDELEDDLDPELIESLDDDLVENLDDDLINDLDEDEDSLNDEENQQKSK